MGKSRILTIGSIKSSNMRIVSWNINGLRAIIKKGFLEFFADELPDILCLQEIKASKDQVILPSKDYHVFWNSAMRKGYSGTLVLSKQKPIKVVNGIDFPEPIDEGRVITCDYGNFYLVTVYTPNSKHELIRLSYRQSWDKAFLDHICRLGEEKSVLVCGDLNVAHEEIDLANPETNHFNPGFSDEERAGFDRLIEAGFVDTFREFNREPGNYTWWSYRARARERNIGWRIDYFCCDQSLLPRIRSSDILSGVMGSDHCPIRLTVDL